METGARVVSGLELLALSKLYGVDVRDILEGNDPRAELTAVFRMDAVLANDAGLQDTVRRTLDICETITELEKLLGVPTEKAAGADVTYPTPTTKMSAVEQGRSLAQAQRERLGLGFSPIEDISAIILRHGIAVAKHDLSQGVSGIYLQHARTRPFILINEKDAVVRQRFSLAHEYCHALLDHQVRVLVSYLGDDSNRETRANAFAVSFLMPRQGILEFANEIGTAPADWGHEDVSRLANRYGLSYNSTVHHLNNLRLILSPKYESLKEAADQASAYRQAHLPERSEGAQTSLREWAFSRVLSAFEQELISKRKALNIGTDLGYKSDVVGKVLDSMAASATTDEIHA